MPTRRRTTWLWEALWLGVVLAPLPGVSRAESGTWVKFKSGFDLYSGMGTACAIDTRRGQAVLFGMWNYPSCKGVSCFGYSDNDVTAFARAAPDPSFVSPTTLPGSPSSRSDACATYDSLRDEVWLFGGRKVDAARCRAPSCPERLPLDDLWRLDLSVDPPQWHEVAVVGVRPAGRHDAAMVVDAIAHRLLLFGGRDSTGTAFADLWSIPLDGPYAWTELQPAGAAPSARWSATAMFDPARNRVWLVGGSTPAGSATDVWSLDVSGTLAWSPLSIFGAAPSGVSRAILDAGRDIVLTYGGASRLALFGLAGTPTWTTLATTGGPSTDNLGGFGYDPVHDLIWLPYHETFPAGSFGGDVSHWLLTLAQPSPVPALDPVLDSVRYFRGLAIQSWRLRPRRSGYRDATVEWSIDGANWSRSLTLAAVDTSEGGVRAEFGGLSPDQGYRSRVAWFDGFNPQNGGLSLLHAPPGPSSMSFDIASAPVGRDDRVDIVWHARNDSLSLLAQPIMERNFGSTGWVTLLMGWPDVNQNIPYHGFFTSIDTSAEFRIRWDGPRGPVTGGEVTVFRDGAPPPPPPPPPPPSGDSLYLSAPRPNPVTTSARIDYRLPATGAGTITLHDLHGRVVRRWRVGDPSARSYPLDLQGMGSGLYLLRLQQAGRGASVRVVIVR